MYDPKIQWYYGNEVDVIIAGNHFAYGKIRFIKQRLPDTAFDYEIEFYDGKTRWVGEENLAEPPIEK